MRECKVLTAYVRGARDCWRTIGNGCQPTAVPQQIQTISPSATNLRVQTISHQLNGTNIGRAQAVVAKSAAFRSTFDRTRGPMAGWSVSVVFLAPHCAAARPAIPVPVPKSKTFFPATRCRCWPRNAARCSPCARSIWQRFRLCV